MKIEIKHWYRTNEVLYSTDVDDQDPNPLKTALERAVLDGARLDGARLDGARLVRASLVRASLDGASLDGASLVRASLDPIRADLFRVLDAAPAEVPALLAALEEGRVNGSVYTGNCACLIGTIAKARQCSVDDLVGELRPNSSRAAEKWFLAIQPHDTPSRSQVAEITVKWVKEWLARPAVATQAPASEAR